MKLSRTRTLSEQNFFPTFSLPENGGLKGLLKSWSKPSMNTNLSLVSTENDNVSEPVERSPHLMIGVVNNDYKYLSEHIEKGEITTEQVLFACVEEDNDFIFKSFINEIEDINCVYEDDKKITLLHVAATKGSIKCLNILLEIGAKPNSWDASGKSSPMHQGAVNIKTGIDIMLLLVLKGGDINHGHDKEEGSVLHHAVRANNMEVVKFLIEKKVRTKPQIKDSETVLHTAVRNGNIDMLNLILEYISSLEGLTIINFKNELQRTPLHLAAENGKSDMCFSLLSHKSDPSAKDYRGQTPFHLAAANIFPDILNIFIKTVPMALNKYGMGMFELVNYPDDDGSSPLAACVSSYKKGAIKCIKILLENGAKLDDADNKGFTPLMKAAIGRNTERTKFLIIEGADFGLRNESGQSAMYFVHKYVPQCLKTFEHRLDTGIDIQTLDLDQESMCPSEKDRHENVKNLVLDFKKISPSIDSKKSTDTFHELQKLHDKDVKEILKHPLSQAFLTIKWNKVKYVYFICNVMSHLIFSLTYSAYVLLAFSMICSPLTEKNRWNMSEIIQCTLNGTNIINNTKAGVKTEHHSYYFSFLMAMWIILLIWTVNFICKQLVMMFYRGKLYFSSISTYLTWSIILCVLLSSFHINPFNESRTISFRRWQYHAASYGCFFTWFKMLYFLANIPKFGKYVDMFRTVARRMGLFMVTYISLLLAFGISFMILFPQQEAFQNIATMMIKVFVMMLGEMEYDDLYYPKIPCTDNVQYQPFPVTAHIILFLFVILASIILMNLLVGLAVSDIQELQKKARIRQLYQQVELIDYIENVLSNPWVSWVTSKCVLPWTTWLKTTSVPAILSIRLDRGSNILPDRIKWKLNNIYMRNKTEVKEKLHEESLGEIAAQLNSQSKQLEFLSGEMNTLKGNHEEMIKLTHRIIQMMENSSQC